MKKFSADVDIDFADREQVLKYIKHIPAAICRNNTWIKHNTGVYVNPIPADPITGISNIDYIQAEEMGYIKLDLLNNIVYQLVKSEDHLNKLIERTPKWEMLQYREFVEQVVHIGNHYDLLQKMPEPVNTIARMSMFISIIRPAKRHLVGLPWKQVAKTIWEKPADGSYGYKKSHAVSYSQMIAVHMNLLCE